MPYPRPLSEEMTYAEPEDFPTSRALFWMAGHGIIAPPPEGADDDLPGLSAYLKQCGVGEHFTVTEICRPNNLKKAGDAGYLHLCPPVHVWPAVAILAAIADRLRRAAKSPVKWRNGWRPQSYNCQVAKSGIDSDHPNGCGVDLDFRGKSEHDRALWTLNGIAAIAGAQLDLSVGVGGVTLHIGVFSPKGARHWTYPSWVGKVPPDIKDL